MPTEQKYRVVFTGKLHAGFEESAVREAFATRFGIDDTSLNKLFSNRRVTVRRDVDKTTGDKMVRALGQVGAICELVAQPRPEIPATAPLELEPRLSQVSMAAPTAGAANTSCPKCGHQQANRVECERCGIIFAKFRQSDSAATSPDKQYTSLRRSHQPVVSDDSDGIVGLFRTVAVDWFRGNVFIAAIVLVLLPIFGSGLIINAVFYTRDHHVLYDLDARQIMCGDLNPEMGEPGPDMKVTPQDNAIAKQWHFDYAFTRRGTEFEDGQSVFCVTEYVMDIGSIGDENVENLTFSFSSEKFSKIFLDGQPLRHIHREISNISSSSPRMHDPKIEPSPQTSLKINNLAPGTLVELKFFGWYPQGQPPYTWEQILADISISQGSVEPGDPRVTGFARFITSVF